MYLFNHKRVSARDLAQRYDVSLRTIQRCMRILNIIAAFRYGLRPFKRKKQVCVTYRNVQGKVSKRILEPLLLQYRWYAWYGLAYDTTKQDYRRFKIARMEELELRMHTFQNHHASLADIQKEMEMNTNQEYVDFDVRCQGCDAAVLNEDLNGT